MCYKACILDSILSSNFAGLQRSAEGHEDPPGIQDESENKIVPSHDVSSRKI